MDFSWDYVEFSLFLSCVANIRIPSLRFRVENVLRLVASLDMDIFSITAHCRSWIFILHWFIVEIHDASRYTISNVNSENFIS